jgi:hypothetical protein
VLPVEKGQNKEAEYVSMAKMVEKTVLPIAMKKKTNTENFLSAS